MIRTRTDAPYPRWAPYELSVCSPRVSGLRTGIYNDVKRNNSPLPLSAPTQAEISRRRIRHIAWWTFGLTVGAGAAGIVVAEVVDKHGVDVTVGIVTVALVAITAGLSAFGSVKVLNRHGELDRLMQSDWKTRRRVGKELRKGAEVSLSDREVASSITGYVQHRRWLGPFYVLLGAFWLLSSLLVHGGRRWLDLGLAIAYLALAPIWIWSRKRVLRHGARLNGR